MKGIIYCLTNKINNKPYIGLTINPKRRKKEFYNIKILYTSKDPNNLSKIDKARFKYGVENFEYQILEELEFDLKKDLIDNLNYKEAFYISKFDSIKNGYNTIEGGNSYVHKSGYKISNKKEEKIEQISADAILMREKYIECLDRQLSEINDLLIRIDQLKIDALNKKIEILKQKERNNPKVYNLD